MNTVQPQLIIGQPLSSGFFTPIPLRKSTREAANGNAVRGKLITAMRSAKFFRKASPPERSLRSFRQTMGSSVTRLHDIEQSPLHPPIVKGFALYKQGIPCLASAEIPWEMSHRNRRGTAILHETMLVITMRSTVTSTVYQILYFRAASPSERFLRHNLQ